MANLKDPHGPMGSAPRLSSGTARERSPAAYLREARALLAKDKGREAYQLIRPVAAQHPHDPFLLSYAGFLAAAVEGQHKKGIESCERAIKLFEKISSRREGGIEGKLTAVLHYNLGMAYLAGGKKKEAFEALQKGRMFDPRNRDIAAVLEGMGVRKPVPLPFLDRSNPVNIAVGRMLRKPRERSARKHR